MSFYQSTIGKKVVVALTGLILFGFVVGHMLGNLQVFAGPEKINDYAHFLRSNPPLLWGTRIILLISAALHIITITQLSHRNRSSRPVNYQVQQTIKATLASRFMKASGILLGVYIVFHLLHLTTGDVHPQFNPKDVYSNMIQGFSVVPVAIFYIVAMVALGFHLAHGIWSVFQTLGLNHEKYNCWRRRIAIVAAVLVVVGYISIPLAVLIKVLQ